MSSEKFESLEDDLNTILDTLKTKVERQIPNYGGEERKSAVRQAKRNVEEANLILQEMEEQAKLAPIAFRTQMLGKIRNFRRDLDHLSRLANKDSGGQSGSSDNYGFDRGERSASSQRSKLMQGTQSLNRATESIARSHQIAAETDQIGVEIIDELGQQRESLVRTKERLEGTDSNLAKSRKILKTMAIRAISNKMILIVIILIELAILVGLVPPQRRDNGPIDNRVMTDKMILIVIILLELALLAGLAYWKFS
ncbi:hypothetical protein ScPMuIL_014799 [Solemya velum]